MKVIETLLPQRYPFLFVDEIVSATLDEIIGLNTYDNSFRYYQGHFPEEEIVPNVILLESIIQCGGAGITQIGIFEKALWGLASLTNVKFCGSIKASSTVEMIVKTLKVSNKLLKQTGTAFCGERVILKATWLCLRLT